MTVTDSEFRVSEDYIHGQVAILIENQTRELLWYADCGNVLDRLGRGGQWQRVWNTFCLLRVEEVSISPGEVLETSQFISATIAEDATGWTTPIDGAYRLRAWIRNAREILSTDEWIGVASKLLGFILSPALHHKKGSHEMKKRNWVAQSISVVLMLLVGYPLFGAHAAPARVAAQCPYCGSCWSYGGRYHVAPNPCLWGWESIFGAGPGVHGWHGYIYTGGCMSSHGVCFFSAGSETVVDPVQVTDEVAAAVSEGDVGRLAHFASHPSVRITRNRMALQVVGCGEAIVGHVPISSELLAAVTAGADAPQL